MASAGAIMAVWSGALSGVQVAEPPVEVRWAKPPEADEV